MKKKAMMITEQNCEEYLLLYVDDELSNAERGAVEAFIKQHPQYALLLEALQQTKLPREEKFVFSNKNGLYKNGNEIGIDNYEEHFLLYTDNELNESNREKTERFVLQHPQLQPEFTMLQQTKLTPETIEYKDKKALYKEEKRRRVIPLFVVRMSVAAAFIGAIVFAWQMLSGKNPNINHTVAINTSGNSDHQSNTQIKSLSSQRPVLPEQKENEIQQAIARQAMPEKKNKTINNITSTPAERTTNQKTMQQEIAISPVQHNIQPDIAPAQTEDAQQKQVVADIAANNNTVTATASLKPLVEINSDEETNTQTTAFVTDDNNAIVQPAVYKELKTDDESQTLYVGAFQINKAKVNGFLKSASHLLGSRAKQNAE